MGGGGGGTGSDLIVQWTLSWYLVNRLMAMQHEERVRASRQGDLLCLQMKRVAFRITTIRKRAELILCLFDVYSQALNKKTITRKS